MERLDSGAAVACSLNDQDFNERRTLARRTLIGKVSSATRLANGLRLTFKDDASLKSDLEQFVELERQCCGFLDFDISDSTPTTLVLTGPDEAASTIDIFAAAVGANAADLKK